MGLTDAHAMAELSDLGEGQLRMLIAEHERRLAAQANLDGFSTALTDDDRRYLDLCAALYALESGGQSCEDLEAEP